MRSNTGNRVGLLVQIRCQALSPAAATAAVAAAAAATTTKSKDKKPRVWEPVRAVDKRESSKMVKSSVPETAVSVAAVTRDATRRQSLGPLYPLGKLRRSADPS